MGKGLKRSHVKQRKTGLEQRDSVITKRAGEQESRGGQQIREGDESDMESENLVMNEGVKETCCEKERERQRFHSS